MRNLAFNPVAFLVENEKNTEKNLNIPDTVINDVPFVCCASLFCSKSR
jgi:hypothetical protein